MATNYVLIDFENVQPANLEILQHHSFKVLIFLGANQTKLPRDLVIKMQNMGDHAQYIGISGSAKNALDFHIAYYIGKLAAADPDAYFHIISRDTGFDPLIKHLKENQVKVQRERDLAEIPVIRISTTSSSDETIAAIVRNLAGRGQSRPRKRKTLSNTINTLFTEKLTDEKLNTLIKELEKRGHIAISGENITYHLSN